MDKSIGEIAPGTRSTDPNYDGTNAYGDETTADIRQVLYRHWSAGSISGSLFFNTCTGGPINVSRTGYTEGQVIDPNTINFKLGGSLNYKITPITGSSL